MTTALSGSVMVPREVWVVTEPAIPVALALAYLHRVRTLARAGRPVPASRQLCFAGGLLVLFLATGTGLETLADDLLTAHMVQHLLLADVAALLLAVGLTGPILRPLLSSPALRWLTPLTNPMVALTLFTANLYLWHIPPLYEAGRGLSLAHVAEQPSS